MKLLLELLEFAKQDPPVFLAIVRWLVVGTFLITLMAAFDFLRLWVSG